MNDLSASASPGQLVALGMLHNACVYIKKQFDIDMDRVEAGSNLEARAILFRCCNSIFRDLGCMITHEEIEGSRIIEREMERL
jgi:hypothetical protein